MISMRFMVLNRAQVTSQHPSNPAKGIAMPRHGLTGRKS
jgi:hypothetical protein